MYDIRDTNLQKTEARLTHADDGAFVVQPYPLTFERVPTSPHDLGQALIKGVPKSNVANESALEKGEWSDTLTPVNDLVRHHKIPRSNLLLQAAHCGKGDDGPHANLAEGGYVGAVGYFVRGVFMVETMTGEEGDGSGRAGRG